MSWHRRHAPSTPATLRWSIPWAGLPTNGAIIRRPLTLLQDSAGKLGTNPEIQYHLAMAHYMMGQADTARAALQKAVAAPDDFPSKREAQRRLNFLSQITPSPNNAPTANEMEEMLKTRSE